MRDKYPQIVESGRIRIGPYGELKHPNGAFQFQRGTSSFIVICTVGAGWEHVSARVLDHITNNERVPNWYEMSALKDWFWEEEDTVMQLHVPKSDYRNLHEHVLHLWRPLDVEIPRPPNDMVAPDP